jgi:hypothetical protein
MTEKLPKNKPGPVGHVPTTEQRRQVEMMAAYGIRHGDIAGVIGIDRNTLMKHYRTELDLGTSKVVAQVANSLVKKAVSDRPDAVNAAKFFLERRAGWTEKVEQVVTVRDLDDAALDAEIRRVIDELGGEIPFGGFAGGKGAPSRPQ